MHVVRMLASRVDREDNTKDIDFSAKKIRSRWDAGLEDTKRAIEAAPWCDPVDTTEGVVIHDFEHLAI